MYPSAFALASVIAFAMAWAIGAQDVSNALGTSVGSKAVTVRQAIYIAGICEFLGSLAGGEVAGMISGGILSVDRFHELGDEGMELYATVMLTTMCGAFAWLAIATYFSLPVSTTHSLVGALIGVGTVSLGAGAINFTTLGAIVSSWVTSPLLGAAISYIVFSTIHSNILIVPKPREAAYRMMPHYFGFTVGTSVTFMVRVGPRSIRMSMVAAVIMFIVAYAVSFLLSRADGPLSGYINIVAPEEAEKLRRESRIATEVMVTSSIKALSRNHSASSHNLVKLASSASDSVSDAAADSDMPSRVEASLQSSTAGADDGAGGDAVIQMELQNLDRDGHHAMDKSTRTGARGKNSSAVAQVEGAFVSLMVMTACVVSIAHGSNDVSNAVGPFSAIAEIYFTGKVKKGSAAPVWVLICGGIGIVVGLGTYGHRVMATIGEKIARLTFTRGFSAQIATALTVLCATQLGLSVSTTHCLIGAITGVALVEGSGAINAQTIRKIVMSWLITVPASAVLGVLCFGPIGALFAPAELSTSGATLGQEQLLQPRPPPLPGAP